MSRRTQSSGLCWELVGLRPRPRRRWTRRFLWLGSLVVCVGYVLKLAWFAVGGSVQIHLIFDRDTPAATSSPPPQTADEVDPTAPLDEQINGLEHELQRERQLMRQSLEPLVSRPQDRDELELHFHTLATRELLDWLPTWLTARGYPIPQEVQIRLTISRQRLAQLERALSELGRPS